MSDDPKPANRGGRPPAPEPGTRLSTWVPRAEYDQLLKMAQAREQSMSSLVRDLLKLRRQ